jgi:hypothetical protein
MGTYGSQSFDPMPSGLQCAFRYNENFAVQNASTGGPYMYIFRATSIFDPNFSGLGHQPYGHDLMLGMYNQ